MEAITYQRVDITERNLCSPEGLQLYPGPTLSSSQLENYRPQIERALHRGSVYTFEDICAGLAEGYMDLWTYEDTVLVTLRHQGVCYLLALAGQNMRKWLDCLETIEEWAIWQGCWRMQIQGRKGWSRVTGYEIVGEDNLGLHVMTRML